MNRDRPCLDMPTRADSSCPAFAYHDAHVEACIKAGGFSAIAEIRPKRGHPYIVPVIIPYRSGRDR